VRVTRFVIHNRFSLVAALLIIVQAGAADKVKGWHQSYKSGYRDDQGRYAGGSEIMHLVPHQGKLYAFNGYWTDANYGKQSAQVLRLDEPNGRWQVDLETNGAGYAHMKGNILKSVTFTTDKNGKKVNETLLVAASRGKAVSVFVRDDATGKWSHTMHMQGKPGRLVPRDCEIFRDRVTGIDRIFLLVGDPGILSGAYNSETKSIEWDAKREHPQDDSVFPARPLGIAEANDRLYFSVGGKIFVRYDGPEPEWTLAFTIPGKVNTDVGGIRGLSTIKNPIGPGESLIFVWTPAGRCAGEIKRLDGPDLRPAEDETSLRELFNKAMVEEKATAHFSLGGYNRLFPFKHPQTGETVHIVGYEQRIRADESLIWNHYYAGACYSIRYSPDEYTPHEVNGRWEPGKQVLVAPRAFALSPFEGEEDVIYFGGHDANFHPSTDMAWIYRADMATVLGLKPE
jgi:hypothetical protein